MHHILYLSKVIAPLEEAELVRLLEEARANNKRRNITGILVYSDRQFMQLIEGEEADLASLYAKLAQDPRHTGVIKLADKPIVTRSFSEWSMAFRFVSPAEFTALAGYLPLAQVNFHAKSLSLSATDTSLLQMAKDFVCAPTA